MLARLSVALSFSLLAACSSATTGPSSGSLVTTTSATGALLIDVTTSPQPPVQGMNVATLVVTDSATHAPVDGLSLAVVPWMPAMGHGTSLVPTVDAMGHGKYEVSNLSLFMAGEWELRLTITGTVTDTANPAFDVP
jgi:YtkA-like